MTLTETDRNPLQSLSLIIGSYLWDAWFLMIGLGVLHHHVKAVPAFGFWLSLLLWVLLGTCSVVRSPARSVANTVVKWK